MKLPNWIELAAAIGGAVLGTAGFIMAIVTYRAQFAVKLQVKPSISRLVSRGIVEGSVSDPRLVIEIVNTSAFPVTVSAVCLQRFAERRSGAVLVLDSTVDGKGFPVRVESRDSAFVQATPDGTREFAKGKYWRVVVNTRCGCVARPTVRRSLRLRRSLRNQIVPA